MTPATATAGRPALRVLVTGLGGTLAPVLAAVLRERGHTVFGWDRARLPPHDEPAGRAWLARAAPDAIAHLATGDDRWAGLLAAWAAAHGVAFLFTSTAMVFDALPDGPHGLGDARTAGDDYGRGKIAAEDAVRAADPRAAIARIGWQIADPQPRPALAGAIDALRGNQMRAALAQWQAAAGRIAASRRWWPACACLGDTADALASLIEDRRAGVFHLDSNADEGWRFDQIATALAGLPGAAAWRVEAVDGYAHDQRLIGGPLALPPLSERLALPRFVG